MSLPSSLRGLYEASASTAAVSSQPYCVPLSEPFWQYVCGPSSSSTDGGQIGLDEAYDLCLRVEKGAAKCDGFQALVAQARHGVLGENEFPGPMCSPMRRLHLHSMVPSEYTFTEKSDGIRTILVLRTCHCFPLWTLSSGSLLSMHLTVVAGLEAARRRLLVQPEQTVETVHLEDGRTHVQLSRASDTGEDTFLCTLINETGVALGGSLTVTRALGSMPVAFAMDRAMDNFYVLCEGPVALGEETAVLDGELMSTYQIGGGGGQDNAADVVPPPLVLGLFDFFSHGTLSVDDASKPAMTTLGGQGMDERYRALQALLLSDAPTARAVTRPRTIHWFVKTMWRVEQFRDCLERLHFDTAAQVYYYHDPANRWSTRNDGFVFTPNAFPIVCGASSTQLKWKWKRSLSVDWRIRANNPGGDLYDMSLFFRKKRFNHQPDTVGHWKLPRPWKLANPHGFVISTKPAEASVAECVYDPAAKQWVIERLRQDKTQANSITTAISVMESLAEDLALVHLLHALHVTDETALARAAALEAPAPIETATKVVPQSAAKAKQQPALTAPLNARAVVGTDGTRSFYLYWCTNSTGNPEFKRSVPAPLCRVSECVGFGTTNAGEADAAAPTAAETDNTRLETVLSIELANAGGSLAWSDFIVDACFNGKTGRWEVVRTRPNGMAQMASFDHTIDHLRALIEMGGGDSARRAIPDSAVQAPESVRQIADASRDAKTVVTNAHYGVKALQLGASRGKARSVLRQFHNWIKSMLLSRVVATAETRFAGHLFVLDICCGRGGDLLKWKATHPAFLFMTDASAECVGEAAARYNVTEGLSLKVVKNRLSGVPARFGVFDAFDPQSTLRAELQAVRREHGRGFAVASCQFSMHYACHSLERLSCFVETVAAALNPGGLFTGTTVSDAAIVKAYQEKGPSFECDTYALRFPNATAAKLDAHVAAAGEAPALPFGLEYYVTIEDTVSDLPEFVVPWEPFVQLCASFSLTLVQDTDFETFYTTEGDTEEGKKLREVMLKKRSRDGAPVEFNLSPTEKEAAALYRAFIFEKQP